MAETVVPQYVNEVDKGIARTVDGFDNFVSRLGLNNDNTLSAGMYTFNLITRNRIQLEAAYRGSWIVGQMIDCKAEDMTRAGIQITTNEADQDIKDFQSYITKKGVWGSLCDVLKWGDLYGGALGVLQIEGQKLSSPLDPSTIKKGQFKGIAVFDRWQLNPILGKAIRSGPDIGLPAYYQIVTTAASAGYGEGETDIDNDMVVHHSRVIRVIGIQLPFFQAITEMMWGESVLERLWDRLIAFDSSTMSSANLIERANNRTVGIEGLREIIAAGGKAQQGLEAMMEMMRAFQTNEGLTLIDKNDTFQTTQYTFSGLDALLLQFGQQLAGACQIPLVRLFGQSPAGLSATGESDLRMYYDGINAKQESKLRDPWTLLLQVMWRSCFGKEPPKDLEFTFTPLWQMSTKERSEISKTNTESVLGSLEAGAIKRSTAMKELRQMSGDTGLYTNISDEEIQEAEEEEAEAPPTPILDPADPLGQPPELDENGKPVPVLDEKPTFAQKIAKFLKGK